MKRSIYIPVEGLGVLDESMDKEYNALDVSVYYSLGGRNGWNGKIEKRGIYFSIRAVNNSGGVVSFMVFGGDSGFKYLILELKRNNKKKLLELSEKVYDYFIKNKERLGDFFKARNNEMIVKMVDNAVGENA